MGYYNLEIRGSFKYPFEALTEQICPQCLCFGTLYKNPIYEPCILRICSDRPLMGYITLRLFNLSIR